MTTFQVLIDKENTQTALNRNLGVIDILPDKIIFLHETFIEEISYENIDTITQTKYAIIEINMTDGRLYTILPSNALDMTRGLQKNKNINRMSKIMRALLNKYLEKIKK